MEIRKVVHNVKVPLQFSLIAYAYIGCGSAAGIRLSPIVVYIQSKVLGSMEVSLVLHMVQFHLDG